MARPNLGQIPAALILTGLAFSLLWGGISGCRNRGSGHRNLRSAATADLIFGSGLRSGFANTDHLPAHVQVNVGLTHKFNTPELGKLDGRVSMINLFDKSYELRDGTGIGVGAPQYGPRRTLYVGMSKAF